MLLLPQFLTTPVTQAIGPSRLYPILDELLSVPEFQRDGVKSTQPVRTPFAAGRWALCRLRNPGPAPGESPARPRQGWEGEWGEGEGRRRARFSVLSHPILPRRRG
jgi:hypothetical protein